MKQHFTEADLLETYYTKPGESMPVMMHLAGCADCAARYERLEKKMQSLREPCAHHGEKPDTFWVRQRMSIMRRIETRRERRGAAARITRIAAAAMLVLVVGAMVMWDRGEVAPSSSFPVVETVASTAPEDSQTGRPEDSPWASDELNEYSSMVAWESWVEDGDQS